MGSLGLQIRAQVRRATAGGIDSLAPVKFTNSGSELEFLNNLWRLGTEQEKGYRTGPPGYIGWRNSFLGIDSWAPETFKNTGSGPYPERMENTKKEILLSTMYDEIKETVFREKRMVTQKVLSEICIY